MSLSFHPDGEIVGNIVAHLLHSLSKEEKLCEASNN
jgi:hypothetical protein